MRFKKSGNVLWDLYYNQKMIVRLQVKEAMEQINSTKDYFRSFSRHYSKEEYLPENTPYCVVEVLVKFCIPSDFRVEDMPMDRIKAFLHSKELESGKE
jgi:hypothetical protein